MGFSYYTGLFHLSGSSKYKTGTLFAYYLGSYIKAMFREHPYNRKEDHP